MRRFAPDFGWLLSRLWTYIVFAVFAVACANECRALEAGASRIEITPAAGTPLDGDLERLGRGALTVHDRLFVRCLYLSDGDVSLFLLTADLFAISDALRERVIELAPADVPADHVIMTATHTHNGAGGMTRPILLRQLSGRYIPALVEQTARRFGQAMQQAFENRRRAALGFAATELNDFFEDSEHDERVVDNQLGVVRVDDSDGNIIALLVSLGLDTDTAPDRYAISADVPGAFAAIAEAGMPEGGLAFFLNSGTAVGAPPSAERTWDRTTKLGDRVAAEVMELAADINGHDAALRVGYRIAPLPPTIGGPLLPKEALIQSLEIDEELAITFWPGRPSAEMSVAMRERLLEAGYELHFIVGLANDFVFRFDPNAAASVADASWFGYFGPGVRDWAFQEFDQILSKGDADFVEPAPEAVKSQTVGKIRHVVVSGSAELRGFSLGREMTDALTDAFERRVLAPIRNGHGPVAWGLLKWAPNTIDTTHLAVARAAAEYRPLLRETPESVYETLAGMARGAGIALDTAWLAQLGPIYFALDHEAFEPATAPTILFGTTEVEDNDRTRVVGHVFRDEEEFVPELVTVQPLEGRTYTHVAAPWQAGVVSGINDAGVVVCLAQDAAVAANPYEEMPLQLYLGEILQQSDDTEAAVEALRALEAVHTGRVLVSDGESAQMVEYGDSIEVREAENITLFGVDLDGPLQHATRRYYEALRAHLERAPTMTADQARAALIESEMENVRGGIANSTRFAVVFEPAGRLLHVATTTQEGFRPFVTLTATGDTP